MLVTIMTNNVAKGLQTGTGGNNSGVNTSKPEDYTYGLQYDSEKYECYWMQRVSKVCRNEYGSTFFSNLKKDDKLGTYSVRSYFLEPKTDINGNYYGVVGCRISMDPNVIRGEVTGMSQLVDINIKTPNPHSRVCSPSQEAIDAVTTNDSSVQPTFTVNPGFTFNSKNKSWEGAFSVNTGASWDIGTSFQYNCSNIEFTQNNMVGDDNEFASWNYDYIAHKGDSRWNKFLCSSSSVEGNVLYRLPYKPSEYNRTRNACSLIKYEIRFGAGNRNNGDIATRRGIFDTSRSLYVETGSLKPEYKLR